MIRPSAKDVQIFLTTDGDVLMRTYTASGAILDEYFFDPDTADAIADDIKAAAAKVRTKQ